ncbi:hypothetical protein VCHA53O466_140088 [Vibrio chagasii]|nr:hypothetical protein VCHA53O466_140088 [Vibrio chagasii]
MYTPEITSKGSFVSIGVVATAPVTNETLDNLTRDNELNQSSAVTVNESQGLAFIDFSEISESDSTITEHLLEVLTMDEYFNITLEEIKKENIRLLQLYSV